MQETVDPVPSYYGYPVPMAFADEAEALHAKGGHFRQTTNAHFITWMNGVDMNVQAAKEDDLRRSGFYRKGTGKQPIDKKAYRKTRNKLKKALR